MFFSPPSDMFKIFHKKKFFKIRCFILILTGIFKKVSHFLARVRKSLQ